MVLYELLLTQLGLVLVAGIFYFVLVVRRSTTKKNGEYSVKEWNYYLKKLWALYHIKTWKRSSEYDEVKFRNQTEEPIDIQDHNDFDSQYIWATNSKGYSIYVGITRKINRNSEVAVILTMNDGTVYRLPNQPDTVVFDSLSNSWKAENLKIILLEPFRRWRIIYNGILAKGSKSEFDADAESDALHVRFNFIWTAGSDPIRLIDDSSDSLIAEAIATEKWTTPNWLDEIKNYPVHGYDQYGCMFGTVTIGDSSTNPVELVLGGFRERRWGKNYSLFVRRSLSLTGMTVDGTYYNINVQALRENLTHFTFGSVRTPHGKCLPITWTDVDISELGEYKSYVRKAFAVKFTAESKQYTALIHLDESKTNLLRGGRPWNWENHIIPYQGSMNEYQGTGILQLSYNYKGEYPLRNIDETKQLNFLELEDIDSTKICTSLREKESFCPKFVGAKSASLALLLSVETKEYKVPNGFCLSRKALEKQISSYENLNETIKLIESANVEHNEEELKHACEKSTHLFELTPICEPVKDIVKKYFDELLNTEKSSKPLKTDFYFAVRSSGIGEDSEELSAAGQNATILGCKSFDDVLKAIQRCWASLFTFQSVEYRRQHGQVANCGMGVVVQTMVDAEAAGVMFTRHPMTGDPSCILITSNYGLGESVVSGTVEPDTIYIERNLKNEIKIKNIDIGSKKHKMSLDTVNQINLENRLQTTELTGGSENVSLPTDECLKLGNIAITQEALWGSPRDIEWAISQGTVYLVQARPVTSLQTWSEYELLHELDSPIMTDDDLLTFANTGEVLPGALSPLSQSIVLESLDKSIQRTVPDLYRRFFLSTLTSTHYHSGLSVTNVILCKVKKEIDLMNKVVDLAIYGQEITDNKMHSIALHRHGISGSLSTVAYIFSMIKNMWNSSKHVKNATKLANSFDIDLSKCKNALEMYNVINESLPNLTSLTWEHSNTSTISSFTQFIFFSILLEGESEISTENYTDIGTTLSSCNNVISADVPTSLNNLAKSIQESGRAEDFCQIDAKNGLDWLESNCPKTYREFKVFLQKHGHRSIKEFDLLTETWGLNPTDLIISLQSVVKMPLKDDVKSEEDDIVSKFVSNIKNSTKRALRFVIPLCKKSVANREETKSGLILIIHKFRLAYRQLAKQMMKEWKLPDEKLIFFMTNSELGKYVKSRDPEYINKAILRRRYFDKWDNLKFPLLCWGVPQPINLENINFSKNDSDPMVKGTPVYSGKIVSRACVVNSLSEISQLQKGDILITHYTDIGWSPYFPLLGGVVTELGGLISHGAVVAREYGLPCIVGAETATQVFKTGDNVLLDATKGVIYKIQEQ